MASDTQFHIVDLIDGPTVWVAIAPDEWILADSCFYPPYDGHKCNVAAANAETPGDNWIEYSFKKLATFGMNVLHLYMEISLK